MYTHALSRCSAHGERLATPQCEKGQLHKHLKPGHRPQCRHSSPHISKTDGESRLSVATHLSYLSLSLFILFNDHGHGAHTVDRNGMASTTTHNDTRPYSCPTTSDLRQQLEHLAFCYLYVHMSIYHHVAPGETRYFLAGRAHAWTTDILRDQLIM